MYVSTNDNTNRVYIRKDTGDKSLGIISHTSAILQKIIKSPSLDIPIPHKPG